MFASFCIRRIQAILVFLALILGFTVALQPNVAVASTPSAVQNLVVSMKTAASVTLTWDAPASGGEAVFNLG